MTDDDWIRDPTAKRWVRNVLNNMAPKLADSAIVAQIVPDGEHGEHGEGDVKFWVELGASIMMDKPIVAVVIGDRPLPAKLELIADEVVRLPEGIDPAGADELTAAFHRVLRLHPDDKEP